MTRAYRWSSSRKPTMDSLTRAPGSREDALPQMWHRIARASPLLPHPPKRPLVQNKPTKKAFSDMLEVLPRGASKGDGVATLLDHLGVDPARLMALGEPRR